MSWTGSVGSVSLEERKKALTVAQARALSLLSQGIESADVCARLGISRSTLNSWKRAWAREEFK